MIVTSTQTSMAPLNLLSPSHGQAENGHRDYSQTNGKPHWYQNHCYLWLFGRFDKYDYKIYVTERLVHIQVYIQVVGVAYLCKLLDPVLPHFSETLESIHSEVKHTTGEMRLCSCWDSCSRRLINEGMYISTSNDWKVAHRVDCRSGNSKAIKSIQLGEDTLGVRGYLTSDHLIMRQRADLILTAEAIERVSVPGQKKCHYDMYSWVICCLLFLVLFGAPRQRRPVGHHTQLAQPVVLFWSDIRLQYDVVYNPLVLCFLPRICTFPPQWQIRRCHLLVVAQEPPQYRNHWKTEKIDRSSRSST